MTSLLVLREHLAATRLADSHEHTFSESFFAEQEPDILRDIFWSYCWHDLRAAGASREAVFTLLQGRSEDAAQRFSGVASAWRACQETGYGEAARQTALRLYGLEEIDGETLQAAAGEAHKWSGPGARLRLLKDAAHLEFVQIDDLELAVGVDREAPEFFMSDINVVDFVSGNVPADAEALTAVEDALREGFTANAPLAAAVKSQHAYERTLRWRSRNEQEAARAVSSALAGSDEDRLVLGDWALGVVCELCAEHNLPLKLHTGVPAGIGHMQLGRLDLDGIDELARRHPNTTIVLLHGGWPETEVVAALAKHFPNIYVDLAWSWAIAPLSFASCLRRLLHSVPHSKITAFGGDTFWPAGTVGYAWQAREWTARALAAEVDEQLLTLERATSVATKIMHENHQAIYDLARIRRNLTAASRVGTSREPGFATLPEVILPNQ